MSSSDPEFSSHPVPGKVQDRAQLNNLPSDADMIDWVESKSALVSVHHGRGEWKWRLWLMFEENGYGKVTTIEENGPTWRAVVEAAMRRLP